MGIWYPVGDGYGKIFVPEVRVRGWGRVCAHGHGSGELILGGEFPIDISRCAHRQQSNPNGWFGGWGYKYPQPPPLQGIQVFNHCIQYKSSRLHSKTQTRDQILSQVQDHSKQLVTSERDICAHLSSCRLDRFSSSPFLFSTPL
jgi:hypothetical protein